MPHAITYFFSSADYSQAELIWSKSVRRPASGVRRRTSTFSNRYFSYIFQSILLKLGTLISWVSPQTLFFSEFWNLDFLIFLWIFIKIHWNCYFSYIFQSILLKLGTLVSWVSPQTLFFSDFRNLHFLYFSRIFIKFSLKSLLLLQSPMDSFATRYTYSLGQSSHLLCRFLKFVFFNFLAEFSSKFHSNRYCSYNI